MPVETRINVPFIPQEGITSQILTAIQLANEQHRFQQQLALQQQAQPSEIALRGAQTQQIQAGLSAGLPQAEADYKTALVNQQKLQTQFEEETHPLNKAMLQTQLQSAQADLQKKNLLLKLMTMQQGPTMFDQQIDSLAPPGGPYADLNQRTKVLAHSALQIGDLEGARAAVNKAGEELSTIAKETNPKVISARAEQAAETAIAVERAHQAMYPAALAGVTPQLIKPATDDATKADQAFTQAQQAGNEMHSMVQLAKGGNKIAYAYSPVTGVLQINVAGQIKRMNLPEIETYGAAGSALDRISGFFGKQAMGASIPDNILDDMDAVSKMVTDGARDKYETDIKNINDRYGAKFNPMPAVKIKGSEAKESPTLPPGAIAGTLNGKHGYVLNGEFHPD